jgi:hypothetical protein
LLPILHRGRIVLARWGCRRNESRVLPCTGWTTTRSAALRFWHDVGGRAVTVPAYLGYEKSVWIPLRSQVRAVLAFDLRGQPHAFVVCELDSADHEVMRHSEPMPVLVGGIGPDRAVSASC